MTELVNSEKLEIRRGWKDYYLFWLIIYFIIIALTFIIPSQRQDSIDFFFKNWTVKKIPFILAALTFPVVLLYHFFDKKVKIRIDKHGIWTKKHGDVHWSDIWYFHSTIENMKEGNRYRLKFRLKDKFDRYDTEIIIKYRHMDFDFEEVRRVIVSHCIKHNINDLGHTPEH